MFVTLKTIFEFSLCIHYYNITCSYMGNQATNSSNLKSHLYTPMQFLC